eukprot:6028659-Amphidinium_carterae.1
MLRDSGKEQLRRDELREFALTPDHTGSTWLQLPKTFLLDDPDGWFRVTVLPRISRQQQRA